MGILDSDIGYQIGLLAGGLWAERYRERGAEKLLQQEHHYNRDRFDQAVHNHMAQNSPSYRFFFTDDHPWNNANNNPYTFQTNLTATKPNTFQTDLTATKPYLSPTQRLGRR